MATYETWSTSHLHQQFPNLFLQQQLLLPISQVSFQRYCLPKCESVIKVFLYIDPWRMTHIEVHIAIKEAKLEMSKKTTQICHIQIMVILAPFAKRNFPPNIAQWHNDCSSMQRWKVPVSAYWTLTLCWVLSWALVNTPGEKKGSFWASLRTQQQACGLCSHAANNENHKNLSIPSGSHFWFEIRNLNKMSVSLLRDTSSYCSPTFSPLQTKHQVGPQKGQGAPRGKQGLRARARAGR